MEIYTVHSVSDGLRSFCFAFDSLVAAERDFNERVEYLKMMSDEPVVRDWTSEYISSQIKVSLIEDLQNPGKSITIYLTRHSL